MTRKREGGETGNAARGNVFRAAVPALVPAAVFLLLWARYLRAAAPHLMPGDSAELAAAAQVLGVAHSPGYPVFVLAGKVFSILVPWGNPAFRMNLFSGFCAAAALALLARVWAARPVLGSAFLLVLAGLGPLFQKLSASTEVFGLNLLFAAGLASVLEPLLRQEAAGVAGARRLLLAAFLFGLGLGNQQTLLLLGPAAVLAAWPLLKRTSADEKGSRALVRLSAAGAALLLAGLSVYIFLYIRSRADPLLDWENPETLGRFREVVSRARYGTLQLAQGAPSPHTWAGLGRHLGFFAEKVLENVGWAGTALAALGLWGGLVQDRRRTLFYLAAAVFSGPLFLFWANVTPSPRTAEVLERFLLLPLLLFLYFPLKGFLSLWSETALWKKTAAVCLLGLLAVAVRGGDWSHPGFRDDFLTGDHGRNVLRNLPPSAHLFADRADETEFSLCYLLSVEKRRPDADFTDANAGVTVSRYGPDYYGVWGKPRLARRRQVEGALLSATDRPFFYATVDLSQLDLPRRAAGLLYEARARGDFSPRTRFPYWDVLAWRLPPRPWGARDRHLISSTGRLLGEYALALGQAGAAQRFLALCEVAGGPPWRLNLAVWHQREGRPAEAEALYRRLLERPGPQPLAWNNLGVLCGDQGRWDEALSCYERAIRDDPSYAEAWYNSGAAHWQRGDWARVVAAFEKTLQLNPGHAGALRHLPEARRRLSEKGR